MILPGMQQMLAASVGKVRIRAPVATLRVELCQENYLIKQSIKLSTQQVQFGLMVGA